MLVKLNHKKWNAQLDLCGNPHMIAVSICVRKWMFVSVVCEKHGFVLQKS